MIPNWICFHDWGHCYIVAFSKQTLVTTSSNHAEIIALQEASRKYVWLRSISQHIKLSNEMHVNIEPIVLYEDNTACIAYEDNTTAWRHKWQMNSNGECCKSQTTLAYHISYGAHFSFMDHSKYCLILYYIFPPPLYYCAKFG